MIKNLLKWRLFKGIAIAVLVAFVSAIPAQSGYAQTFMPAPGQMVHGTASFTPTLMKGVRVDVKNPFNLYFLMTDGQNSASDEARQQEYEKLIKYFLASLVIPNKDMWVNLSPKEATRIIPDNFSMTEMGRDLLAQDYLLKQFTASLMYPEDAIGKEFWNKIYQKAYEQFGTTDIPVDTFNKVWIRADRADIYQKDDTAFLVKTHLKVMLEQDILAAEAAEGALEGAVAEDMTSGPRKMASDIVRDVIVPVIEKEVNEGANFAPVRQAYYAMILATWFKKALKDTLLGQVYADQGKVQGIAINDPQAKDRIYAQYMAAYKTGVFNYIKEEYDVLSQETLPRKYFAGGIGAPLDAGIIHPAHHLLVELNRSKDHVLNTSLVTADQGAVLQAPIAAAPATDLAEKTAPTAVVEDTAQERRQAEVKTLENELKTVQREKRRAERAMKAAQLRAEKAADGLKAVSAWKRFKARVKKFVLLGALMLNLTAPFTSLAAPLTVGLTSGGQPVTLVAQVQSDSKARDKEELERVRKAQADLQEKIQKDKDALEASRQAQQQLDAEIKKGDAEAAKPAKPEPTKEQQMDDIRQRAEDIDVLAKDAAVKKESFIALGAGLDASVPLGSEVLGVSGSDPMVAFYLKPKYPGSSLVEGYQIASGLGDMGGLSLASKFLGYARLVDIATEIDAYVRTHENKNQTRVIHTDKNFLEAVLKTLTVNWTPIETADQENKIQKKTIFSVGIFDTIRGIPGLLDRITFHKATGLWRLLGRVENRFPFEDNGAVLEYGMYQKAFRYYAGMKPVSIDDTIFLETFQITDQSNKYVMNKAKGYDVNNNATNGVHYRGEVRGYRVRLLPDGQIFVRAVYASPAYITPEFVQRETDNPNVNLSTMVVRPVISKEGLENQTALVNEKTKDGQRVYGALRHPVTGEIVRLITDPGEMMALSKAEDGTMYMPKAIGSALTGNESKDFKPRTGVGAILVDYVKDEVSGSINSVRYMVGMTPTVAEKSKGIDLNNRPAVRHERIEDQIKDAVKGYVFDSGATLKKTTKDTPGKTGWVHFFDDKTGDIVETLTGDINPDVVKPVRWLKPAELKLLGAKKVDGGIELVRNGRTFRIGDSVLVQLPVQGKAFGIFEPSLKTKKEWRSRAAEEERLLTIRQAGLAKGGVAINVATGEQTALETEDGFVPAKYAGPGIVGTKILIKGDKTPVVVTEDMMVKIGKDARGKAGVVEIFEAGRYTLENRETVLNVKINGGWEVEDQATGKFLIFAKGNAEGPEKTKQVRAKVRSEGDLIPFVAANRLKMVPVDAGKPQGAKRMVIVPKSVIAEPRLPAPVVTSTLDEFTAQNALVVFKGPAGREETQFVSNAAFASPEAQKILKTKAKEILRLNGAGDTVGRLVPVWGAEYEEVSNDKMLDFLNSHCLAVAKDGLATGFIPNNQLKAPKTIRDLRAASEEILIIDLAGNTAGRMVPVWNGGYEQKLNSELPTFLKSHALVVTRDSQKTGFIALEQLGDPGIRDQVRKGSFELQMINTEKEKVGYVYLSPQPLGSRLEMVDGQKKTTEIYPLFDYQKAVDGRYFLDTEHKAIGGTRPVSGDALDQMDPDYVAGEEGVLKLDYQLQIATIEVFSPLKPEDAGTMKKRTPVRVIDVIAQTVTHNDKDGREQYRNFISPEHWSAIRTHIEGTTQGKPYHHAYPKMRNAEHHGLDMVIDGNLDLVKEVTTITRTTERDGLLIVDYIEVRDKGWGQDAPAGRIIFDRDGNRLDHYTGHVFLPKTAADKNGVMDLVTGMETFDKRDHYVYASGDFLRREVSERRDNNWILTRTIEGLSEVEIGRNDIDFQRFMAVPEVRAAMAGLEITADSVLQYTPVKTVEGVEIVDYRKLFDPLEKKVITVHRHQAKNAATPQIVKIVVATRFDALTGEVTESFTLNRNYEVEEKGVHATDDMLKQAGISRIAGDIFGPKVVNDYKNATGGQNLWEGLEREGITPATELVIVKVNERLTNPDGSFSNQWTPDEYRVMRPNDNTGRILARIRGNGNVIVNPWWDHGRLADLELNRAHADSVVPSPNILPRSVKLHHNGKEHEVMTFDRFTEEANGDTGMRYDVQAEFQTSSTSDLATGGKIREEYAEGLSVVAQGVNKVAGKEHVTPARTLNYDTRSNRKCPVNAVDTQGKEIARWESVRYDEEGNETQVVRERHPLFKYWQKTLKHFDKYGEERDPAVNFVNRRGLWAVLGLILLFPVTIVLRAFQTSKKRNKIVEKIKKLPEGRLYDEEIATASEQRFAAKVLNSLRNDPNVRHLTIQGDPEATFLFGLKSLYVLGISRYAKAKGISPDRYQELVDSEELSAWDEYAVNVGRYLAEELSRGAVDIHWDHFVVDITNAVVRIAAASSKAAPGSADAVDDLDKLKAKLLAEIKNAAVVDLLVTPKLLARVQDMVRTIQHYGDQEKAIIAKYGLRPEYVEDHFMIRMVRLSQHKHFDRLKKSIHGLIPVNKIAPQDMAGLSGGAKYPQIGKSDQQIWDKMEAYLADCRDRLAVALDADITHNSLENGEFDKVAATVGIVKGNKVSDFYYRFQEFLKENKFDRAPSRVLKDSRGHETYIADAKQLLDMFRAGTITRKDVDAYRKSLNRLTLRTFLGWGIKAIHPLMIDWTVLPRMVLTGLGIGVLTLGKTTTVLAWLSAPVFGVPAVALLAGIGLVLAIGAYVEYRNIAKTDRLSVGGRIILGAAAVAGIVVLASMPMLGMGTLFLKAALMSPLILETFTLAVMGRSILGFNLFDCMRPSSEVGRPRTHVLVWANFFSFVAIMLGFGWATQGYFATQVALGVGVKLIASLVMFVNAAYLTNSALWRMGRAIAARVKPSQGIPKAKPGAVEEQGPGKEENFLINYVGPVLGSLGVMKEHIKKPEDIAGVVDHFIKALVFDVKENARGAVLTLEGIRQKAGIPAGKSMEEFIEQDVRAWMTVLFNKEFSARMSLLTDEQLMAEGTHRSAGEIPEDLSIVYKDEQERQQLIYAKEINQMMSFFRDYKGGINPYDAAVSLIGQAYMLRDTIGPDGISLGQKTLLLFTYNNKNERNQDAIEKFIRLFGHISGAEVDMAYSPTAITMKSGAMNGMFALPQDYVDGKKRAGKLKRFKMRILDRNSNAPDLRRDINDMVGAFNNPNLVATIAYRDTTPGRSYLSAQNYLVEVGQGDALKGFNEKTGTGWENIVGIYTWDALMKLSNLDFPRKSFSPVMRAILAERYKALGIDPDYALFFGMVGFAPQAVGMSEDRWSVLQQSYIAVAKGDDPEFALTEARHKKRREDKSNFELGAAPPRWSGGRNQTISSFMNQIANDIGPGAFVEREADRSIGRGYTALPSGLLNLLLLPISVFLGFNPFEGLWLGLAAVGTVFNQIDRLHGVGAMIDDSGFLFGTARGLFYQMRDAVVFATRVSLETLAYINSYGGLSFLFNISGASGSAYYVNTWEKFKADPWKFISFKNVVILGGVITGLLVLSTATLSLPHLLFMFPLMFWGVSNLIGLFVTENKPGTAVWGGKGDNIAAWGGALAAIGYAVAVHAFPIALAGLLGYAVAMPLIYKLVRPYPKLHRLVSQFNRYFVRTSAGALLFALVPTSAFVKLSLWPNIKWVVPIQKFVAGVGLGLGGIMAYIGLGYIDGAIRGHSVEKTYRKLVARFWEQRDSLDPVRRMVIGQRFHDVNSDIEQLSYKRARKALEEIRQELDGQVAVLPILLKGPSPRQDDGEDAEAPAPAPDPARDLPAEDRLKTVRADAQAAVQEQAGQVAALERREGEIREEIAKVQGSAAAPVKPKGSAATALALGAALASTAPAAVVNSEMSAPLPASRPVATAPAVLAGASAITAPRPLGATSWDAVVRVEKDNIRNVLQRQRSRVEELTDIKNRLKTRLDSARTADPQLQKAYRQVASQIGIIEKRTMGKLNTILNGQDPLKAAQSLAEAIRKLKYGKRAEDGEDGIEALKKIKTRDVSDRLARKRAELAEKRKQLAYLLKVSHAININEMALVTDAVEALAPRNSGEPFEIATLDQGNAEAVIRKHEGSGDAIRFFAGLKKSQKVAALKATITQVKAQNLIRGIQPGTARARVVDQLNDALKAISDVGGIDFNDAHLIINIEMDSNGIPLAARYQDPRIKNIPGLKPVIRSIEPLDAKNIPALFELVAPGV